MNLFRPSQFCIVDSLIKDRTTTSSDNNPTDFPHHHLNENANQDDDQVNLNSPQSKTEDDDDLEFNHPTAATSNHLAPLLSASSPYLGDNEDVFKDGDHGRSIPTDRSRTIPNNNNHNSRNQRKGVALSPIPASPRIEKDYGSFSSTSSSFQDLSALSNPNPKANAKYNSVPFPSSGSTLIPTEQENNESIIEARNAKRKEASRDVTMIQARRSLSSEEDRAIGGGHGGRRDSLSKKQKQKSQEEEVQMEDR